MVSEVASRRAPSSTAVGDNVLEYDKGKRNIVDSAEV